MRDVDEAARAQRNLDDDVVEERDVYTRLRSRLRQILHQSQEIIPSERIRQIYPRYSDWISTSEGQLKPLEEKHVFANLVSEWNPVLHGISHLEGGFDLNEAAGLVRQKWTELKEKRRLHQVQA